MLFDNRSFPKLEQLRIGGMSEWRKLKWTSPPIEQPFSDQFPLLEKISLKELDISFHVADYLGTWRRQTGCSIHIKHIDIKGRTLPLHRQQLLDSLDDINIKSWKDFCQKIAGAELYQDFKYWNIMPDRQFKAIAYAAALQPCTNVDKFKKFMSVLECEDDLESCGLTAATMDSLKTYMATLSDAIYRFDVNQKLTWRNLKRIFKFD